MKINPLIFKAYDIRGKYPEQINEEVVSKIGAAFVEFSKAEKIAVGQDNRLSSKSLKQALIAGLKAQGAKVIDIGLCSTPAFYFGVVKEKTEGGLMISASHLERDFNGLIPVLERAIPLTRSQMKALKALTLKAPQGLSRSDLRRVKMVKKDINSNYIKALKEHLPASMKKLKIVMDAGNGVVGLYLKKVFEKTPLEVVPLFWELDSHFPNRGLNPKLAENRQKLAERVQRSGADLGFIWDGDGDRFFALDSRGELINPNFISVLIGKHLILKNPENKKIVVDVRASRMVQEEMKKRGGEVMISRTWHPEIKRLTRETGAVFGSETSGHYIFKDFYWIDDGILAAIYLLRAISEQEKEPRSFLNFFLKKLRNKYFILEEKNFPIKDKKEAEQILARLEKHYQQKRAKLLKIDGLTCEFKDWRFNLRLSETEPYLRLNLEANSQTLLEEKEKDLSQSIINY